MPRGERIVMPKTQQNPALRGMHAKRIKPYHSNRIDEIREKIAELINDGIQKDEIQKYISENFKGYIINKIDWMSGENRAKVKKGKKCGDFRKGKMVSKEEMVGSSMKCNVQRYSTITRSINYGREPDRVRDGNGEDKLITYDDDEKGESSEVTID